MGYVEPGSVPPTGGAAEAFVLPHQIAGHFASSDLGEAKTVRGCMA